MSLLSLVVLPWRAFFSSIISNLDMLHIPNMFVLRMRSVINQYDNIVAAASRAHIFQALYRALSQPFLVMSTELPQSNL